MRSPLLLFGLLSLPWTSQADDWPQWRGPQRNGISPETGWLEQWPPDQTPPIAWRIQVGRGHSAASIDRGLAYTMGWDGRQDTVYCLDAATGAIRWQQSYPCRDIVQWSGPRATAAVADGAVYTLGQHGQLRAWDAVTGQPRWAVDLPAAYQPDVDYGFPWSPLVHEELLVLGTGGKGLAFRTRDGAFAWGNDGRAGACVSPMPFLYEGRSAVAVVAMDASRDHVSVVGVDWASGRELWRFGPWPEKWGAACSDLVMHEGRVFFSTAEQHKQCAQFQFDSGSTREVWRNRHLSTYTGNVVLLEGFLYGVDKTGLLKCLAWSDGEERWAQRGFGEHGTLMAADGRLLVQSGKTGFLSVVKATPSGFQEERRAGVFAGEAATFTPPVLSGGRIYCRSYAGEVVCLNLTP